MALENGLIYSNLTAPCINRELLGLVQQFEGLTSLLRNGIMIQVEEFMQITVSNWNHCYYSTGRIKSMLVQGFDDRPCKEDLFYWVMVLKDEKEEVFQAEFYHLSDALNSLNKRYGHWDFVDNTLPPEGGGCASCSNRGE